MDGDCGSSCAIDGKMCSCDHSPEENVVTLCGCDHHGNELVSTTSPFPIKALLQSSFDETPLLPNGTFLYLIQNHSVVFADDIFHPPRLIA